MRHALALAIGSMLATAHPAHAWWDLGHQTVARLAWKGMSRPARREVKRLLRAAPALGTPTCRLRTLADAAVWPDCVRADPKRFGFSFPWHYVNVSICPPFALAPACPTGTSCVTEQIAAQTAILADPARMPAERLQALAFVAHFVGDVHMPLHVGENGDKGGNGVRVAYPGLTGANPNLHALWDGPVAAEALGTANPRRAARALRRAHTNAERNGWRADRVDTWARESWELSRTFAYPDLGVGDACNVPWPPRTAVPIRAGYMFAAAPLARARLARAGARLAATLDAALAPGVPRAGPGRRAPGAPAEPLPAPAL